MHFSRLKLTMLFILFGCGSETEGIEIQVYEGRSLPEQGRHYPGKDVDLGPDGAVAVEPIDMDGVTVIDVGP
ncbi:MAG TPA: hypothetical protein EYN66_01160, partial [Myxococcales bacterium]|nr:hypothetical protein [Myxococcales bacterium]